MNYLTAKTELLKGTPKIALKMLLIEAAVLVAIAGVLVQTFA